MISPRLAVSILWILWLLSWMLAARWTNATRVRQSGGDQLRYGVWIWIGAILLLARLRFLGPLSARLLPAGAPLEWAAFGVACAGVAWAWWARVYLGRMWSSEVTLKAEHALVRSGPYAFTRHPIYTGLLLSLAATAVMRGSGTALVGLVFLIAGFAIKLRQEERLLIGHFGPGYEAYRTKVRALIPGIW